MTDARVLLAFASLVVWALLFASYGVKSALAPLCAVGSAALWLTLFGTLGQLWAGGLAYYILTLAALIWLGWRHVLRKKALPSLGFGFWFFVAAGLFLLVLLWAKQPMLTDWDEFSFWGTAGKLTKLYNELYTTAPVGWAWTASQTPILIVINYLFQFFGGEFVEWQTYAAVDVLQLAAMAALLSPFEKKRWNVAIPVALCCLLVPFAMVHYRVSTQISPVFLTSLADIPMGLLFGGALASWFGGERKKLRGMIPVCIALAMLTLTKDIAIALALVAVVVIFVDALLAGKEERPKLRQRLGPAAARGGLGLGAMLAAFIWWNYAYLGSVAGVDRLADSGGKQSIGLLQMPFAYISELFSPDKSELFTTVNGEMVRSFLFSRGTLLGSGAMVASITLVIVALAAALTKIPAQRKRCIAFGVTSTLGFVGYYAIITTSYIYMMRPEQALALDSYDRYVYPYYIGWFLVGVMLLGITASEMLERHSRKLKRRGLVAAAGVLAVAALLFVRVGTTILPQHTWLGVNTEEYNERRAFSAHVERLREQLDPQGKTFLVMSDDLGLKWFMYCHEMLPWQVDYSFGGGELVERTQDVETGETLKHELTAEELAAYLVENGCTTLYIDNADERFFELYGDLFEDGGEAYRSGETHLYEVVEQDGAAVLYPVDGVNESPP